MSSALAPASQDGPPIDLDADLAAIPAMSWAELRQRWSEVTGRPHPRVRHALLRLALAWEMQAAVLGGHSQRSRDILARLASDTASSPAHPPTGKQLIREWRGVLHVVTVGDDGIIRWNEKDWRSLSEVARAITGTRWSGPAFFGLKDKAPAGDPPRPARKR